MSSLNKKEDTSRIYDYIYNCKTFMLCLCQRCFCSCRQQATLLMSLYYNKLAVPSFTINGLLIAKKRC